MVAADGPVSSTSLTGPLCLCDPHQGGLPIHTSLPSNLPGRTPDLSAMTIEVEPFGGLVVRWQALDAWLLVDVSGAYCVWRGRVVGRVAVGLA
jgi:hypothetical protein